MAKRKPREAEKCQMDSCVTLVDGPHRGGCEWTLQMRICQACVKDVMLGRKLVRVELLDVLAPTPEAPRG